LSELIFSEFVELVVECNVRPERPDNEDAPQLSDAIWELAEKCWLKVPKDRLTASAVCDILCHLLDTAVIAQATASPFSHPITQANPPHLLSSVIAQLTASSSSHSITQASSPSLLTPAPNQTLRGHTGEVWCATFSANGKYIVSGSWDRTICV
jgi:WD40 repeat protein